MPLEGYVHELEEARRELAALPRQCAWRGYSESEEPCGADAIHFRYEYEGLPKRGGYYVYICRKHAAIEGAVTEACEASLEGVDPWEDLLGRARKAESTEDVVALIERKAHIAQLRREAWNEYYVRLEAIPAPATVEELDLAFMETIDKARGEIPRSL